MRPRGDRFDGPGRDELAQCGLGDANVTADPDETDTPLRDQPPREALTRGEQLGGLSDSEQSVGGGDVGCSFQVVTD